jgi:hypothetical protein
VKPENGVVLEHPSGKITPVLRLDLMHENEGVEIEPCRLVGEE